MSNDLLFPILPREGKVPIKSDNKIKRIVKEAETKGLGEDERQEHDEERRVTEQHLYHRQEGQGQQHEKDQNGEAENSATQTDDVRQDVSDNREETEKTEGIKHLDIYI